LPPLYNAFNKAVKENKPYTNIWPNSPQFRTMLDLRAVIHQLGKQKVNCKQLAPNLPWYIGSVDACKYGMGGVWLSGTKPLHPIVWRVKFPPDIVQLFEEGHLSINDLEAAAILMGYLLLAAITPLQHAHIALWSDNTSAVAWTRKMSSMVSQAGQLLTRALFLRFVIECSSPLAPLNIAGEDNSMADLPSRSYQATGVEGNYDLTDSQFFARFNSDFPLTQEKSWLALRPSDKLNSLVYSALRLQPSGTESWTRLPKYKCDIGSTGSTSAEKVEWTPFSTTAAQRAVLHSSVPSLRGYAKGMLVEDVKSVLGRFRTRFQPSARPLNWTADQTPSTSQQPTAPTSTRSGDS
jgi:hypothetical protein